MESTYKLQRRFRLLFTLPSLFTSLITSSAVVLSIILIQGLFASTPTLVKIETTLMFVTIFLFSILFERIILIKHSFATVRRLLAMSIIPNTAWAILSAFGLYRYSVLGSEQVFYLMVVMGVFTAISIRIIILGSVFFKRISLGILVSFIQPVLLFSIIPFAQTGVLFPLEQFALLIQKETLAFGLALIIPVSSIIYLVALDKTGGRLLQNSPILLLQAFLQAWVSERPKFIEDLLEKFCLEKELTTSVIEFSDKQNTKKSKQVIVVPEIHPGPFHPIGSSNLPFELSQFFSNKKIKSIIFHGISGHEQNLASRSSVNEYIDSMENLKEISEGDTCTEPQSTSIGRATVTGFALGDHAFLILTLAPYGMEDFPIFVREEIVTIAKNIGFNGAILIDAHNSQGVAPVREDCEDIIRASKRILRKIRFNTQLPFSFGYAHSDEINVDFKDDVGPAGIGLALFEIAGKKHSIVSVDANNIALGFRDKVVSLNKEILDICTTDTHFNAAKVMNSLGYTPFGAESSIKHISKVISKLTNVAEKSMKKSKFIIKIQRSPHKIFGSSLLDEHSTGLDRVFNFVKIGGILIFLITFAIYSAGYILTA